MSTLSAEYVDEVNYDHERESSRSLGITRSMERPRNRTKVYGKTGNISAKHSAMAALFDERQISTPKFSSALKSSSFRQPLDDVTNSLRDVHLDSSGDKKETRENAEHGAPKVPRPSTKVSSSTIKLAPGVRRSTRAGCASTAQKKAAAKLSHEREWLVPLITEFGSDGGGRLEIEPWADIFDVDCTLEKIAESSFAEVYRITNGSGSSILKLMSLRPPKGPGSQRASAVQVTDILSEVVILDIMADIPGFVVFKGVRLIEGKPPRLVKDAYDKYAKGEPSEFPKPSSYPKTQLFIGIEMADAGIDIERFHITDISEVWDIFLGVVVALSKGESAVSFEHRDLHQGNVCVKKIRQPPANAPATKHKANTSGLQVTIIDYTLSRASKGPKATFRDLEKDPDLFEPFHTLQSKMYRRMRMWTIFRTCGLQHKQWDRPSSESDARKWSCYLPFNNVIWIHYVLEYLIEKIGRESSWLEMQDFLRESRQLRAKLNPDLSACESGFISAIDVLEFCVVEGWIDHDDLDIMESSLLEGEVGETG